jgi:hypothetical protein
MANAEWMAQFRSNVEAGTCPPMNVSASSCSAITTELLVVEPLRHSRPKFSAATVPLAEAGGAGPKGDPVMSVFRIYVIDINDISAKFTAPKTR